MNVGYPSMTVLLGLLAPADYRNHVKLARNLPQAVDYYTPDRRIPA